MFFAYYWIIIVIVFVVVGINAEKKKKPSSKPEKEETGALSSREGSSVPDRKPVMTESSLGQQPKITYEKNRLIAKQLMEGDPVPKGYCKRVCSYCGADNLIPQSSKESYVCFFCREKI